jgi:hypothetical protein
MIAALSTGVSVGVRRAGRGRPAGYALRRIRRGAGEGLWVRAGGVTQSVRSLHSHYMREEQKR